MVAIYHAYYNFCRVHQTLRVTPAMEAGLASHVWSLEELVGLLEQKAAESGMTPKGLIAVGLTWLLLVVVWACFFDGSFAYGMFAQSAFQRKLLVISGFFAMYVYIAFLIGWIVPLGLGIYRLVRHP